MNNINLFNRKIVFWGTGAVARRLVTKLSTNKDLEKIWMPEFYIDSYKKDERFFGWLVVSPDEMEGRWNQYFIVIVTDSLQEILKLLLRKGLEEKKDFIWYKEIPGFIGDDDNGQIMNHMMFELNEKLEKLLPMPALSFSVHLCDHCNLNCAWCNNFAPLAKEKYTDLHIFERDFNRLSELFNGEAYGIRLTGGEPLLNPDAAQYAVIARKYFPMARISFITNGLLIQKQTNDFWELCRKNDIIIDMTRYPIEYDYDKAEKYIIEQGCKFDYQNGRDTVKSMRKETFSSNYTSKNPAIHNFLRCYKPNNCIQLVDGTLTCTTIACAHHFIDYFKPDIHTCERDYINIYEAKTADEILTFLAKPFPFCQYCDIDHYVDGLPWKQSQKDIHEYM